MLREQVWQFHVENGLQFDKNGETYFRERATEMAETIGCRFAGMRNVELGTAPGGKWLVTGTVSLEKANAHA